jgi:hypothetical protein
MEELNSGQYSYYFPQIYNDVLGLCLFLPVILSENGLLQDACTPIFPEYGWQGLHYSQASFCSHYYHLVSKPISTS